jgi:hypothetical protein
MQGKIIPVLKNSTTARRIIGDWMYKSMFFLSSALVEFE